MAFPQVQTSAASLETTDTGTHDLLMPSGIQANDLLVAFCAVNGNPTINSTPAGWAKGIDTANNNATAKYVLFWKRATGSETDTTFGTSTNEQSANRIYRISVAHTSTDPEFLAANLINGTQPNPPTFNPTGWDVEDTLWFATYGSPNGLGTTTGWPTNYSSNQNHDKTNTSTSAGAAVVTATRESAAASEDPAAFTASAAIRAVSYTVAIRPAAAIQTITGSLALSGSGTLAAAGIRARQGASALSGSGAVAADGAVLVWGPPKNLIATAISTSQIDLTWDAVTGATGYDVERNGVVIATDVLDTAYQDTGLASSTSYTYRVRAVA